MLHHCADSCDTLLASSPCSVLYESFLGIGGIPKRAASISHECQGNGQLSAISSLAQASWQRQPPQVYNKRKEEERGHFPLLSALLEAQITLKRGISMLL